MSLRRNLGSRRPVGRDEVEVPANGHHVSQAVARGEHELDGSGRWIERIEPTRGKRRHKQFRTGKGGTGRGPGVAAGVKHGRLHPVTFLVSGDQRPAVVGSRPYEIDLVVTDLSVLGDEQFACAVPGKSLRVPMAVGINVRSLEWIVLWHLPAWSHAQDLAR